MNHLNIMFWSQVIPDDFQDLEKRFGDSTESKAGMLDICTISIF